MCFTLPLRKVGIAHLYDVATPAINISVSMRLLKIYCYAVHAAVSANTFAIYGTGHVKELTELVPGILNQLGPDSLASLRKLAESYQAIQQSQQRAPEAGAADDDDVPDLVENFEVEGEAAKKEEATEAPEAGLD
jgi:hypothetical protein